ncbi:HI1506-related protein [Hoeflea sp.]|uniref:HI1506-related protein n=1 Tax=Hoeflea sp. TaxID=1940281 RepID=UPI003BAF2728
MDDLTRIKGVGAATAKKLVAAGVASFADLAALNAGEEPLVSIAQSEDQAAGWIAAAAGMASAPANAEGKPLSSDETPEAQLQDGARLPADSRVGDRQTLQTNTPPEQPSQGNDQDGSGNAAAPAQASVGTAADWASQIETDSELADFCPHLTEALRTWSESSSELPKSLVITSKREGFRRAGIAHPRAETEHEFDRFDFDDIEQMLAEPVLTVRLA